MSKGLVYGIGINDADYKIETIVDGKRVTCPYYRAWSNMLKRAYDNKYHKIHPTYVNVYVCKSWHIFSNFKKWMKKQDWKGKQLDKDILRIGNKKYSPKRCVFVSQAINNLLINSAATRGTYPIGVSFDKDKNKYRAQVSQYGKLKHLGYFTTPEEASLAYKKAKYQHIYEVAKTQPKKIRKGLIKHAELLLE